MRAQGCIPNIGPQQQRRRLLTGLVLAGLAAGAAWWLITADAPRPWRAIVALPVLGAALGLLQVRAKTCVALAARGQRNMDAGAEPIGDAAERAAVSAQARRVNLQAAVTTIVLTAALLAWP